jgi:uncharacterized membrane protein
MTVIDPDFDDPGSGDALFADEERGAGADVNLGAFERGASVTLGTALVALALSRRRGLADIGFAALGSYLAVRGATGHCAVYDLLDTGTRGDDDERLSAGAHRDASSAAQISIARPPADVYAFWRNLENAPRFMEHVESVKVVGERLSHWTVRGPRGHAVEWDAEIVEDRPGELLAWRALPGSDVRHQGAVTFRPQDGGAGTEVHLELDLALPGGRVGRAVGRLLGRAAAPRAEEDLARLRRILEAGESASPRV